MRARKGYDESMAKIIVLASMWKRAFAHLVDLVLSAALFSLIYFPGVFPFAVDHKTYAANQDAMVSRLLESGLYAGFGKTAVNPVSAGTMSKVEDLSTYTVYQNQVGVTVHLVDNLYTFYTERSASFGGANLSSSVFDSTILKLGTAESNIAGYEKGEDGYLHLTLIDEKEESTSFLFFKDVYNAACSSLNADSTLQKLDAANRGIAIGAVLWAFPPLLASFAVFFLLFPLCFPDGQTIGKRIFKLVVLTKDGYSYPKGMLVWRFFAYFLSEVLLTLASFGASLMISYTMAMFTKKHRSIHDYLAGSVVASQEDSLWFKNALEEERFDAENEGE